MFDHARNISGEIPEHIDWIHSTAIPRFEAMGVKTRILRSDRDYMHLFKHRIGMGKCAGKIQGFPLADRCYINSQCKVKPIKQYLRSLGEDVTQYIGIAADEPKRLLRLNDRKISLLAKYGYTEAMAKKLCEKHNLLSPIYQMATRNGCWFCPNSRISTLSRLRKLYPDLWQELEALSHTPNMCSTRFNYRLTLQEVTLKIDKFDKRQKEAMEIREKQLTLFPEIMQEENNGKHSI